jgi:hypothetical protein
MNNNQKTRNQIASVTASIGREHVNDLRSYGMNVEEELEKILSEEINKAVYDQVLNTLMFDKFAAEVNAKNREGKIDSILDDKDYTPINIEDTEEFKNLSEEYKEKWRKNGRLF